MTGEWTVHPIGLRLGCCFVITMKAGGKTCSHNSSVRATRFACMRRLNELIEPHDRSPRLVFRLELLPRVCDGDNPYINKVLVMYRQIHVQSVPSDPVSGAAVQKWAAKHLPEGVIGHWCRVAVRVPVRQRPCAVSIAFGREQGWMRSEPVFLTIGPGSCEPGSGVPGSGEPGSGVPGSGEFRATFRATGIIYIPCGVVDFEIASWDQAAPSSTVVAGFRPISRATAALSLLAGNRGAIGRVALAAVAGRWTGARHEMRRVATMHYASNYPRDYGSWINLFGRPPRPTGLSRRPVLGLVFGDPASAAFAA